MKCPQCASIRLVRGAVSTGTRRGPILFDPMGVGSVLIGRATALEVRNPFVACLECGLLWKRIEVEALKDVLARHGNPGAKRRLDRHRAEDGRGAGNSKVAAPRKLRTT